MSEHTILVALTVEAESRTEAQLAVMAAMPDPNLIEARGHKITSWWVAEDDRMDGSDNDSAVFCNKGSQSAAFHALYRNELTGANNNPVREASHVEELVRELDYAHRVRNNGGSRQAFVQDLVMLTGRCSLALQEDDVAEADLVKLNALKRQMVAEVMNAMKEDV